jgi:hypothetical protein
MPTATVIDELIDALRDCEDLDTLQAHVSCNEHIDRYMPPLGGWLRELVNTERRRRAEPDVEVEYPIEAIAEWPIRYLVPAANHACVVAEGACLIGDPQIVNFAFRLQQLLVGYMGFRLLRIVEGE